MAKVEKKKEFVRFNVNLTKDAYDALVKLQEMSDKSSLAETLRDALKLYMVIQEGREEGKEVFLIGQDKERERIVGP